MALCLLWSCTQPRQTGYEIKGTIAGVEKGIAILKVERPEEAAFADTTAIENGAFLFTGEINDPTHASITIQPEGKQEGAFGLILENSKITAEADYGKLKEYYGWHMIEGAKISGGPNNTLAGRYTVVSDSVMKQPKYDAYNKALKELDELRTSNSEAYREAAEKFREERGAEGEEINKEVRASLLSLVKANPNVEYSADIIKLFQSSLSLDELEEIYNTFTPKVQNSYFAEDITEEIAGLKAVAPGMPAPDFTLQQPDGSNFTLSSLNGKYVLVDFWASWCVPCRKAVPELKELYAKYKDKGFEIVGVANDTNHDAWKKAINEDQTPWIQVVDEFPVKNKPSRVGTMYAIHFLPSYFLIDSDGKMIGKMEKDEVKTKLKELLD